MIKFKEYRFILKTDKLLNRYSDYNVISSDSASLEGIFYQIYTDYECIAGFISSIYGVDVASDEESTHDLIHGVSCVKRIFHI